MITLAMLKLMIISRLSRISPILRLTSASSHLSRQTSRLAAMANVDNEDFGLSSSDEADLAELTAIVEAAGNRKRSISQAALSAPKKLKQSPQEYPTTSELARKILKETWGYSSFRLKQEEAISRLIHGGSAVVVFPTGGGKSLVYQVPALAFDDHEAAMDGPTQSGLTLVVSPLIALMKVRWVMLSRRSPSRV